MTIVTAQYASWSHGSRYPVKLDAAIAASSTRPTSQLSARPSRKPPVKKTRSMWRKATSTSRFALQWWTDRTKAPNSTSPSSLSIDAYASPGTGV